MKQVKVLDCTLRDGGYYCEWDFDEEVVRKYLAAMSTARVDVIEIGFRFLPQKKFMGAFAYSTDEYLRKLPLSKELDMAVMVNAKELLQYEDGAEAAVAKLFLPKSESRVDMVRIATHLENARDCNAIAKSLFSLGYSVVLNLMQVDSIDADKLTTLAADISEWDCVEVLYFADSFGSMSPPQVESTIASLAQVWSGELGIHAHDNKGQALLNSLVALNCGVKYVDATLLGMGRGAGNAKTEHLLVELTHSDYGQYYPDALFPLVLKDFKLLQDRYGWGVNTYYYLSAVYGIHPTYIQEMLGDERYDTEQILSAINFLKSTRAPFYSFENMLRALSGMAGSEQGKWSAEGWVKGRDVLIVGAGPGTRRYIAPLQEYAKRSGAVVLCLNINEAVPEEMVNAYVACHETRILIESDHYAYLGKPLILPMSRVPEAIKVALDGIEIFDYGLRVEKGCLTLGSNGCVLNSPLAIAYAISIASVGGAERILLAGMDGYAQGDPRQQEMVDMFKQYASYDGALPILAITPTTYPIEQRSVFEVGL